METLVEKAKLPRRKNTRRRNHMIFYVCVVALPLLQFCICYIYVNLNSFILAFQQYGVKQGELGFNVTFAKFENFKEAWSLINERWFMFGNSLRLFFWVTIVGFTLALLFSFYIYKKYPLGEFFRVILFMPKIISGVVFALLFKYIADDVFVKIMNDFLHQEVELGMLANSDTQLGAVLFYNVWIGFGINVLMFSGSMSGIDESIVESAQLDGTNLLQEFIHVTLPMIWPTFVSFLIINITGIFTDQMSLHSLYGNSSDPRLATFGYYLYVQSSRGELIPTSTDPSFSVLSSMGLMLTAVMMPLTLGVRRLLNKYGPSTD